MSSSVVTIRRYLAESTHHAHDYHQIVLPYVGDLELEADGRGGLVKQGVGARLGAPASSRSEIWQSSRQAL